MIGRVHRLSRVIARRDGDLAKQLRRASSSVGLNFNEGFWAKDGNRTARLETAMCSGRETRGGLQQAGAAGYLSADTAEREADDVDRIVATLWKLTYRRR
jgi:four helix bundle protein